MSEFALHRDLRCVRTLPGTAKGFLDAIGIDGPIPGTLDR